MKKTLLVFIVCLMVISAAGCNNNAEEKGLAGSWVLDGATISGTEYTAKELQDMASELGEFGQLLEMKLVFKDDGTGEMVYEGLDLGDIDMTVSWEGEGSDYSMTDSNGSKTELTFDEAKDTLSMTSGQTKMVFKRAS